MLPVARSAPVAGRQHSTTCPSTGNRGSSSLVNILVRVDFSKNFLYTWCGFGEYAT